MTLSVEMTALGISIRAATRDSSLIVGNPYLRITSCLPVIREAEALEITQRSITAPARRREPSL
jgi:hypothetical protein